MKATLYFQFQWLCCMPSLTNIKARFLPEILRIIFTHHGLLAECEYACTFSLYLNIIYCHRALWTIYQTAFAQHVRKREKKTECVARELMRNPNRRRTTFEHLELERKIQSKRKQTAVLFTIINAGTHDDRRHCRYLQMYIIKSLS